MSGVGEAQAVPAISEAAAWQALSQVLDPELPLLSVLELGIVRSLRVDDGVVHVSVTPTYTACPATEVIQDALRAALLSAGASAVRIELQYAPAWSTDWIAPQAAEKLRRYGIAAPHPVASGSVENRAAMPLRFHPRPVRCPRCDSPSTEQLSAFGSTACKALYRCLACREPFEYFKPI
ncbi:MAG: 1,2-phenylacetyl-CoA epoxidase subunit PaaD [Burkholderiaceae bacterium]